MTQSRMTASTLQPRVPPRAAARVLLVGGLLMAYACAEPVESSGLPGQAGSSNDLPGGTAATSLSGGSSATDSKSGGSGSQDDSGGSSTSSGGSATSSHTGIGGTMSSIPTSTKLRVKFHTYSPTQLTFVLENTDSDPYRYVPLASLRMRYWFTPEGALSAYTTRCDQIDTRGNALKCSNVVLEIGEGDPPYLEISFDVPATWRLWGTDSISRLNVALMGDNTQGTQPDLTNDYSYMKTSDYTVNEKVAIYQDGVLAWGKEPEGAAEATGEAGTGGAGATGGAAADGAQATGGAAADGAQATGGSGAGGTATGAAAAGGSQASGGSATAASDATAGAAAGANAGPEAGSAGAASSL